MKVPAIPEQHHGQVLDWAAQGKTTAEIALELQPLGVRVSRAAVGRLLRKLRLERAEVTRSVVEDKLSKTVGSDLDTLGKLLKKTMRRIGKGPEDLIFVKLSAEARALIETRLKFSGAGDEQQSQVVGPTIFIPVEDSD